MVDHVKRCVIVAASPQTDSDFIKSKIREDDFVICADGGADKLISTEIVPDRIIGDMDSTKSSGYFNNTKTTVLPVRKDDTDTMYCVKTALEMGYKDFLILGATGARLDHTLANLSVLLYLRDNGAQGVITDRWGYTLLLKNGDNFFEGRNGAAVSIMPFASESVTLSYDGLMYPLENTVVSAEYPYTISNVITSDLARVTLHSGTALVIFPTEGA